MPQAQPLDSQFSASKIKHLLESVTPARLSNADFLLSVEQQIESLISTSGFGAALMKADPHVWQAAASVRKGHQLIFHCFCTWGMPIEKVITLLMTMKPSMVVPMTWSKNFIDLFTDVCAYIWKPGPLAAQLAAFEGKEKIPAVSLKILLRSAYRKRQLDDILLAIRVHMPEMNVRIEQALAWLLEDLSEQPQRLNKLTLELFSPHILKASLLQAQANPEIRQVLWGTPLTYESRLALGSMRLIWHRCPLAEGLGWQTIDDVYAALTKLHGSLGIKGLNALLAESSDFCAIVRTCLIQEGITPELAQNHLPSDVIKTLVDRGFLEALLADQSWRHLPALPDPDIGVSNIGVNVDTVV